MVAESEVNTLESYGITNAGKIHCNLPTAALYEHAIRKGEGRIGHGGPLVVQTGHYTGRSPKDKFFVREPSSQAHIAWGEVNKEMSEAAFELIRVRLLAYLQGRELFVQDRSVGADHEYRLPVRVISTTAWHSLFARTMFLDAEGSTPAADTSGFTVIHAPEFKAVPAVDGTRSEAFIIIHLGQRLVLIGGTHYAGEIKKAMFTVMNYLLPLRGVLPLHSSVNVGTNLADDAAIFFGLSGTGKTTLSTDSSRELVGDDEHGWSERGVFNFEGGCYAKVGGLSAAAEPEIYGTTHRFGTVVENAIMRPSTRLDLDDLSLSENSRAAYPITHIANARHDGMAGHPRVIIMLTADAFGVLPPISKLTTAQAIYHFISGYTAKVSGTERGVTAPRATFSACFGAPFMPLPPPLYARLLKEKIDRHGCSVWLINTGWTGGAYGVGHRIPIAYTRAMVRAALSPDSHDQPFRVEPTFGLSVPTSVPGVPTEALDPRTGWTSEAAYESESKKLARMFIDNFAKYQPDVAPEVRQSGPRM